jgi:drug/metabolite transporter (DMT)-like permease
VSSGIRERHATGLLVASASVVDAPVTPELAELEARPARHRRPALGYAMVIAAASLWGINGTFVKVALQSGLSTYRLAEVRCTGGAILFVAAAALTRPHSLQLDRRELPWMIAFGLLGLALVQFLFFVGIERLDIGVAIVLQYLSPVWVALWARFVVKEPLKRRLWYGLALALAGLTLVVELWSGLSLNGVGVAASLFGSLTYAVYILLAQRSLGQGRDVLSLLAWGFVFATLFWSIVQPWWTFPTGLLDEDVPLLGRLEGVSVPFWLLLSAIIVLGTFVPFILMIGALHHLPATRVTVTAMVEPVVGAVVAFAWLGESLGAGQIVGGFLVLAGVGLAQTARPAST